MYRDTQAETGAPNSIQSGTAHANVKIKYTREVQDIATNLSHTISKERRHNMKIRFSAPQRQEKKELKQRS